MTLLPSGSIVRTATLTAKFGMPLLNEFRKLIFQGVAIRAESPGRFADRERSARLQHFEEASRQR